MSHHSHSHTEEKNYDYIYYLVAIITGLFCGETGEGTIAAALLWAVIFFLFALFYLKVLVNGRKGKA